MKTTCDVCSKFEHTVLLKKITLAERFHSFRTQLYELGAELPFFEPITSNFRFFVQIGGISSQNQPYETNKFENHKNTKHARFLRHLQAKTR